MWDHIQKDLCVSLYKFTLHGNLLWNLLFNTLICSCSPRRIIHNPTLVLCHFPTFYAFNQSELILKTKFRFHFSVVFQVYLKPSQFYLLPKLYMHVLHCSFVIYLILPLFLLVCLDIYFISLNKIPSAFESSVVA